MTDQRLKEGVSAGRLSQAALLDNFCDLHPPLDPHLAQVAADRCFFCHDAPCTTACPTDIDIPLFIRQISTGMPHAAAKTILSQNILGGMCARVCPTETLCEQACVRNESEGDPVQIGLLQRYATDAMMAERPHPFERAAASGKRVAVVGAGPAGLSCAHRLAMHGHEVTLYDGRDKLGGLNEFGIATYKSVDGFAQREVEWLLQIGGISIEAGKRLGDGLSLAQLSRDYDAVFLAIGLGGVNALSADAGAWQGVTNAVDFISDLRQADDLSKVAIGRDVVVIGGGMTAIDAAVQAKLLGALNVTLVYRRSKERMAASEFEQDLAASKGVVIITSASPVALSHEGARMSMTFEFSDDDLKPTGERFTLQADQVFSAIGQTLAGSDLPALEGRKIAVDENGRTQTPGVWAGGDCASGGDDLTVTAVAEGRIAAEDIHAQLTRS